MDLSAVQFKCFLLSAHCLLISTTAGSMRSSDFQPVYEDLFEWCRHRDFAGHDPFDALNSRLFQATPLKRFAGARLVWTQLLKRSPLNLRAVALVPSGKNAKAIALFTLAALSTHRHLKTDETAAETRSLLNELLRLQVNGYRGAAWGYNFDWQSRHFFAPKNTPMIVPTAFAARALIEAYESFGDDRYLQTARSSCDFILEDLKRTVSSADESCFSYSPLDHTRVFNASLLAAETLATVGRLTGETDMLEIALNALRYVVRQQRSDGSWAYGGGENQEWVDNFHTAYLLISLKRILKSSNQADVEFGEALKRGYQFWREGFFLADGWPKYYHDTLYPVDAHAAATAIVALVELQEMDRGALPLAEQIVGWILRNLRDASGYFYYQRRRFFTIHTPFMRWTEAWMTYALARLLET